MTKRTRPDDFSARRWTDEKKPDERELGFRSFAEVALRRKMNDEGEFFINFFERCNLQCGFCYQKHDDWTGIDGILGKVHSLLKQVDRLGSQYLGYQVNMMGGELFMDEVPDEVFEKYFEFVIKVSEGIRARGKYAHFHFVTNLIFSKTERVTNLLEQLKRHGHEVPICVSYDFSGRFNKATLEVFKRNLETFFPSIKMISTVLTKPNVEIMLGKRSEESATIDYLKSLYNRGLYCYFDYFSPQHNAESYSPSDQELFEAFSWLIEHFPKSGPVQDMFDLRPQKMSCRADQIVQPDGTVGRCRILVDKRTLGDFGGTPYNFDNGNMQGRFVENMGCLQCEYFDNCGLGCFLLHDYDKRPKMDTCLFRKLYQKIDGMSV
ncbi:MAG: radical SAM protein [Oligoflexia bacterium]|nr:radical SAM protein [Oligoflexia bacterium]